MNLLTVSTGRDFILWTGAAFWWVPGTAVKEEKIQRVADVHAFPGHIACDSASNSEIVLPVRSAGRIVGVLDIDSPVLNRFSEEDEKGLSDLVMCIGDKVDFDGLRG